jgi:hypothetical protein
MDRGEQMSMSSVIALFASGFNPGDPEWSFWLNVLTNCYWYYWSAHFCLVYCKFFQQAEKAAQLSDRI